MKGCPEPVIENEIRKTVIDFCERSTIWRHALDPITIEVKEPEYELCDIPTGSRLVTPIYVEDEGNPLVSTTPENLDIVWPRFGGKWPIDRLDTIPAVAWRDFEEDESQDDASRSHETAPSDSVPGNPVSSGVVGADETKCLQILYNARRHMAKGTEYVPK